MSLFIVTSFSWAIEEGFNLGVLGYDFTSAVIHILKEVKLQKHLVSCTQSFLSLTVYSEAAGESCSLFFFLI